MANRPGPSRGPTTILPRGTGTVGVWVAISGVLAYAFLAITGHALGATTASGLSTLWVVGFLVGNAAGLPVEQEVARAIANRRARGVGVGPVIRRAAIAAGCFTVAVVVVVVAFGSVLVRELFGGDWVLLIAFEVLFVGTMLEYLVRGVLAGEERFGAYGRLLGVESATRVAAALALALGGVDTAGPYAIVLAIAPFVGILAALVGSDGAILRQPGPEAPWRELSRALGWLLAASVLAQALMNLGPVFVRLLEPDGSALVSAFVASLIVARVPVFLFQAAQAALLPRLSRHAGEGDDHALLSETHALVLALGYLTVVVTIGAYLFGPAVVRIGWGADFALRGPDFAILAAASCIYLVGVTVGSALIARKCPNRVAFGWGVGVAVLVLGVVIGHDTLTRVEFSFLAGTCAAAVAMVVLARAPLRAGLSDSSEPSAPVPDSGELPR